MEAQTANRSPDILLSERQGAIAVLTLNRPSARNSLSLGLIAALHAAVEREGAARDVAASSSAARRLPFARATICAR